NATNECALYNFLTFAVALTNRPAFYPLEKKNNQMKTLFKPLLVLAVTAIAFTSCMKSNDDTDYEAEYLKQEKALDSLFTAERTTIQSYVEGHHEYEWEEDTATSTLPRLGKTMQGGIWDTVRAEPTSQDDLYEYKAQNVGYGQIQIVAASNGKLEYSVYSL